MNVFFDGESEPESAVSWLMTKTHVCWSTYLDMRCMSKRCIRSKWQIAGKFQSDVWKSISFRHYHTSPHHWIISYKIDSSFHKNKPIQFYTKCRIICHWIPNVYLLVRACFSFAHQIFLTGDTHFRQDGEDTRGSGKTHLKIFEE